MATAALRIVGLLLMLTALAVPLLRAPPRSVESLVHRWAPPPSEFLDLQGQLVHYRDEGPRADGAPIVLLHGTSASLHTWEGWVRALRGQRRVITLDLPAFGLTGPFAGAYAGRPYTGREYARFVLDVLDRLGVQRFVVGGNSLGGEVAWQVAAAAPQRVERLVLVDASGHSFASQSVPLGFRIARLPGFGTLSEWLMPRAVVVSSLHDVYGDPAKVTDTLVDRYFEMALREGNRRALAERMQLVGQTPDEARIATLTLPTLILWGQRDRLIPPAVAQRFAKDIAGSRLVVFETLGHVPHEEDPAATVAPVKAFLGLAP
ncbi:alpha/beta fold hydrolase [Aquincola sp. S2]|uniref:Alpha/beta fold hydrolase n=1 Tax=Pseudaquabacterium terrae TaxID=2732868 RepID=A0ABX2EH25_9BURK|nr:alpha/beta fold hydrolase [Aquabacterium terrae]NRF67919.1 alpha/beta fold hydrolase [Aquabacterium terrae]